jgi:hypothetical protein
MMNSRRALIDHLVGAGEQRRRHVKAEQLLFGSARVVSDETADPDPSI